MTKPTTITFSKGYERLQEIANEVNQAEIPVDVLGDRFAEGKGLEKALNDYLAGERARIEQIEREVVFVFLFNDLNAELPLRIVAILNRFPQVTPVKVRILT